MSNVLPNVRFTENIEMQSRDLEAIQ